MKLKIIYACFILFFTAQCKSKSQMDAEVYKDAVDKTMKENSPAKNDVNFSKPDPSAVKDILGSWELKYVAEDKNGNKILDDDEKNNPSSKSFQDYLQFKADGSCVFSQVKVNGHYEIKEESGKKKIYIYNNVTNEKAEKFTFYSATANELVLIDYSGGAPAFDVFESK